MKMYYTLIEAQKILRVEKISAIRFWCDHFGRATYRTGRGRSGHGGTRKVTVRELELLRRVVTLHRTRYYTLRGIENELRKIL